MMTMPGWYQILRAILELVYFFSGGVLAISLIMGASGAGPSFFVFDAVAPHLVAPSSIPRSSWVGFLYPARIPR
jgi:hypothetical protein